MDKLIKELDDIKKEVKQLGRDIAHEVAKKAEADMLDAHKQIVDDYYNGYEPKSYHRHKKDPALKRSIVSHLTRKAGGEDGYYARVKIGSSEMPDHTRTGYSGVNQDNVFDLVWNEGIRGLPHEGSAPLDKSYTWLGHKYEAGDIWTNPFWGEKYHNIFNTTIKLDKYSSGSPGKPDDVFSEFVNNWGKVLGPSRCDEVVSMFK